MKHDKLSITLRDLVLVSELLTDLERSTMSEVLSKPEDQWLQATKLASNASDSQRPLILQKSQLFDSLVFDERIHEEYSAAKELSSWLEKES